MVNVPNIKLNSGFDMPQIGFGLWKVDDNCADVVYEAIKAGYRLLDGACGMFVSQNPQSPLQLPVANFNYTAMIPFHCLAPPQIILVFLPLIFPANFQLHRENSHITPVKLPLHCTWSFTPHHDSFMTSRFTRTKQNFTEILMGFSQQITEMRRPAVRVSPALSRMVS